MAKKYSRYGSYFLATEEDEPTVIKGKPINRKRFDFVKDTDPENFADNISDDDIDDVTSDDIEDIPEDFPMGDISDEPDEPSDAMDQFPDDTEKIADDEAGELDIPDFPEETTDDQNSGEETPPEFPSENNEESIDNNESIPSDSNSTSTNTNLDGNRLLDEFNKKFGTNMPSPDEIIEDLKKQVYDQNPNQATQNIDNNSDISDFPTDTDNNQDNTETPEGFPEDETNPMAGTSDDTLPNTNLDQTGDVPGFSGDETAPADQGGGEEVPGFPGEGGGEVITPDNEGDTTDFTNGTDQGAAAAPTDQQQQGPGVGYDSMRKYNLYQEFNNLLSAIGNYISKLENIMLDEPHQNLIIKTVIDKLTEVKKLCYDYMTMKYEVATYAQSYVFFEELTVSVQIIFTLLMSITSYNVDDNTKSKNSKKAKAKK